MGILRDKHNQIKLMIWKGFDRDWGADHTNFVNCNANKEPLGINAIFKCSEIYGNPEKQILPAPGVTEEQFDLYTPIRPAPKIADVRDGLPKISSLLLTQIEERNIAAGKRIGGIGDIPTITVMYDSRAYPDRRNIKGILPQFLMDLRVYGKDYGNALDVAEHLQRVVQVHTDQNKDQKNTGRLRVVSPEEEFSLIAYLPGQIDTLTSYSFLLRIIV